MHELTDEQLNKLNERAAAGDTAAAALEKSQADVAAATKSAADAVAETLRTTNPDLPADAIAGNTVDEVKAAAARARSIADHALEQAKTNATTTPAAPTTPAAGPSRDAAPQPSDNLRGASRISFALRSAPAKE